MRLNIFIPLVSAVFTLGGPSVHAPGGVAGRLAARSGVAAPDNVEGSAASCDGVETFLNLLIPEGKLRPPT